MDTNDINLDDDDCSCVDLYAVVEGRVKPKPTRVFDSDNEDDEKEAMRIRSEIRRANKTQRSAHQQGVSFPSVEKPKTRPISNTSNCPKSEANMPGRNFSSNQNNQEKAAPSVPDIIQTQKSQTTASRPKLTVGHDVHAIHRNREIRPGVSNVTRPQPEMLHEIKEKVKQMERREKHVTSAASPEMLRAIREKAQHIGKGPVSETRSTRFETIVHASPVKTLTVNPTMTNRPKSSNCNEFKEKGQNVEMTRPNAAAMATRQPKSAAMTQERQGKETAIGISKSGMDPLSSTSMHDSRPTPRMCQERSTNRRTLARSVSPTWEDHSILARSAALDDSPRMRNVCSAEKMDKLRSEKRTMCDALGRTKSTFAAKCAPTTSTQSNGQLKTLQYSEHGKGNRTNGLQWDAGRSPATVNNRNSEWHNNHIDVRSQTLREKIGTPLRDSHSEHSAHYQQEVHRPKPKFCGPNLATMMNAKGMGVGGGPIREITSSTSTFV